VDNEVKHPSMPGSRSYPGYGVNSRIRSVRILRLSEDLPMVVEIVDEPERIANFAAELDEIISDGLMTIEKVEVVIYRHNG